MLYQLIITYNNFFFIFTAGHQSWRCRGHFYGRRWFGSWIVHLRHWCIYCQKWCWYRYHCWFSRIQHFICDCRMRIRSKRSLKVHFSVKSFSRIFSWNWFHGKISMCYCIIIYICDDINFLELCILIIFHMLHISAYQLGLWFEMSFSTPFL